MIQTAHGVPKRKVGSGISGTWTVDTKSSFDRTAEEDSQSENIPSYVEMTAKGVFTCVIFLVADSLIPSTPFGIRLRWKYRPVAQLPGLQAWHSFHFDGNYERGRGLI